MSDALLLLVPIIGFPLVILAIASPFLGIWYQNKRNSFFKEIATKYNLKYTQNYPYKTFLWNTILSNPPQSARLLEGSIGGSKISVGDYISSIYWWPGYFQYISSGMQTRFFVNEKEQKIPLPFYWDRTYANRASPQIFMR